MKPALSPAMSELYDLMPLGKELSIEWLFRRFVGGGAPNVLQSEMQQRLGPYITRLNRRLKTEGEKIVPGVRRGTYVRKKVAKKKR